MAETCRNRDSKNNEEAAVTKQVKNKSVYVWGLQMTEILNRI
jgi:hypothetical protein